MNHRETVIAAYEMGNLCASRGDEKVRHGDELFQRGLFPQAQERFTQGAIQYANAKALFSGANISLDQALSQPEAGQPEKGGEI